jgi:Amt family ammonium transporter
MKKLLVMLLTAGAIALTAGSAVAQGGGASHGDADSTPASAATAASAPAAQASRDETILAQAAAPAAAEAKAEQAKPTVDKGDVTWMLVSTVLVVAMIPGLALFYGGMVRAKNMLSVLMQVLVVFSLIIVLWYIYGYSWAFTGSSAFVGGFDKLLLSGVTLESLADTFTDNVKIPEYVFVAFQATFAGLTCALIVGAFAERIRFSAVLIFSVIWFTFAYAPIAHMVWGAGGYLLDKGALDFAGGTVVHINAGIAGLVGAYLIGKRVGYGREAMPPHNLPLTMFGAALLWVGWFGFNAGSNLEANATTALVLLNTMVATSAAIVGWTVAEWMLKGKPSMLGAASGAVAGLVAITPACGSVGPGGAVIIGVLAGVVCLWGVNGLKRMLGADDSLDVFGVHGVGGILGAILTGVFAAPSLGGTGGDDFSIGSQVLVQAEGVLITIVVSAVVALIAFKIADMLAGLRVAEEEEREGLDTTYHGESAYKI